MKKIWIALSATGLLLTACGNEGTVENEPIEQQQVEVVSDNPAIEETETEVAEPESENVETETEAEKDTQTEVVNHGDYAELREYGTIVEQVGADYTFETVTDNEGNRVLFLNDHNGEKQYKTIFVKYDQRLEIIKVNGEGGGKVFEGKI
ncbi:hypothetical protein ACFOZY_00915 [Chungangia koreensis]|uniref:Lipoprotein n=1 Tax=Chungangia koreensis TaxID=752657 RepID=A0ABV8X2W5_9LACT